MSSSIAFVLIGVLAVGEFLLFGALAEAYRGLSQLREKTGVTDQPLAIDLKAVVDRAPSGFGLPLALDDALRAVVIYVEGGCATCRMIVNSLGGGVPTGVWLVAAGDTSADAERWLVDAGFATNGLPERVAVTSTAEVQERLGIRVTPLALSIKNGKILGAQTVPSVRQFYSLIPTILTVPSSSPSANQGEVAA